MVKKVFISIMAFLSILEMIAQDYNSIKIPTESHRISIKLKNGIYQYKRKSDNYILNGGYLIYKTKLNTKTDIVNSYFNTGIKFEGNFNDNGYKNGLWKTTYKNKLVKTENWKNGLMVGRYRVYNTKGKLLYKTTFGAKGNGKFKDYYYKTGVLKQEGNYENGKKEGKWCDYYNDGTLSKITIYDKGVPIKKLRFTDTN